MNQVLEIDLRDDSHYDGNMPHPHPHLVCTNCNRILDAALELDASAVRKLERASGFRVTRPQVTFYGLCADCKRR